jgi:hypothetical protein
VADPGLARGQTPGHLRNGPVGNAQEDDVGTVVEQLDAALREAGCNGRSDAAASDDCD